MRRSVGQAALAACLPVRRAPRDSSFGTEQRVLPGRGNPTLSLARCVTSGVHSPSLCLLCQMGFHGIPHGAPMRPEERVCEGLRKMPRREEVPCAYGRRR